MVGVNYLHWTGLSHGQLPSGQAKANAFAANRGHKAMNAHDSNTGQSLTFGTVEGS